MNSQQEITKIIYVTSQFVLGKAAACPVRKSPCGKLVCEVKVVALADSSNEVIYSNVSM